MKQANSVAICILLLSASIISVGRQKSKTVTCKAEVFAALKPLPELSYQCPSGVTDESDERILKSPERLQAINSLITELGSFNDPAWWNSPVSDLNACYLRGKPGALSDEEREQFAGVEYQPRLLGNNRIRLVVIPDPCYQTAFNGSNAFLLYRIGPTVYVTQILNGYYSRLAPSVFLHLFRSNSEQMIEIETANISGMRPETSSHYFVIDKTTHKAVPKKWSKRGRKLAVHFGVRRPGAALACSPCHSAAIKLFRLRSRFALGSPAANVGQSAAGPAHSKLVGEPVRSTEVLKINE